MGVRESKEWKTWRKMSTVLYAYVVKKNPAEIATMVMLV